MEKHIDRQATGFAACAPLVKVDGFWKIPKKYWLSNRESCLRENFKI